MMSSAGYLSMPPGLDMDFSEPVMCPPCMSAEAKEFVPDFLQGNGFFSDSSQMICPDAEPDAALPAWDATNESQDDMHYIFNCHTQVCPAFRGTNYCPKHKSGKNGQAECFDYHFDSQRRRPLVDPFTGRLRYWDVMCEFVKAGQACPSGDLCTYAHNKEEISFHAAKFRTKPCIIEECRGRELCCFAHDDDQLRDWAPERYSFWQLRGGAVANGDQYLPSVDPYGVGALSQSMGALYHPEIYKHRFCASFPDVTQCRRGSACAFAHSRHEIRTPLLEMSEENMDPSAMTDDFFMYKFKTLWCPVGVQHDWQTCVYAHNYQDARRHPSIGYGPKPCPYWKRKETDLNYAQRCPLGVRCPYSHGAKEQLYHPSYFKTVPCQDGPVAKCPRGKLCAFWHQPESKLRRSAPNDDAKYNTPLSMAQITKGLQGKFLSPPFELLSNLQANNKGKGMSNDGSWHAASSGQWGVVAALGA